MYLESPDSNASVIMVGSMVVIILKSYDIKLFRILKTAKGPAGWVPWTLYFSEILLLRTIKSTK